MIVRQVNEGWTVVFHTSHGLLAERIASNLREGSQLPFWFETQVAIGQHDDHHRVYLEGRRKHLTDAGAPRDFTLVPMGDKSRVEEMQDRIDETYRKHTWMGIMQSKHAECLYAGEDVDQDMVRMLAKESDRREHAMRRLNVSAAVVQATYDWMQFCDRLSLILCGEDIPAMNRHLEIFTDTDGTRFDTWKDTDDRIRIAPWPFVEEPLKLSIECRTVNRLSFKDDADLGRALKNCDVEMRSIVLHAGNDS